MVHFDILICRFILAQVVHLRQEPEIRQALQMWKYVLNHSKAKGSLIQLLKKCSDEVVPNEDEITPQFLKKAFHSLK